METTAAPPKPWCLFKSDSQPFAIGLESVAEVVEADRLVRISHCPPQVLGLCALRRDIVPILCLNPHPAADEAEASSKPVVLILKTEQGAWGIRIDREGTTVAEANLEDRDGLEIEPGEGPAVIGTVERDGTTHRVIDPLQTWRNVREHIERWYRK